jgi:hypothetical protein
MQGDFERYQNFDENGIAIIKSEIERYYGGTIPKPQNEKSEFWVVAKKDTYLVVEVKNFNTVQETTTASSFKLS